MLLCRKNGTDWDYVGANYTVAEGMDSMMSNMQVNMTVATLYELKNSGLINVSDENLNKSIFGSGSSKKLGEYTITELINAIPLA